MFGWPHLRCHLPTRDVHQGRRRGRMSRGRRRIPGITVYQLKSTWAYRITGEPETVSGRRIRPYKGGFATEEEAWRAGVDAKKRLESGRTPHAKSIQVCAYFQEWLETVRSNLK